MIVEDTNMYHVYLYADVNKTLYVRNSVSANQTTGIPRTYLVFTKSLYSSRQVGQTRRTIIRNNLIGRGLQQFTQIQSSLLYT